MSRAVDGLVVDPGTGSKAPGGLGKLLTADQPFGMFSFTEKDKI